MKLNKLFMGILGAMALTACSSEEIIPDQPTIPEEELNSRFMTVSIRNSEHGTRAAGEQSGELYEEGLENENKVESIRFYFFDKDGNPYKISYTGKSYFDCKEIKEDGINMPNVEKKLKAVIVLTSDNEDEKFEGVKSMIAICNFDKISLSDENLSISQLKDITDNYYSYGDSKTDDYRFVMTSSSFGASEYGCEVEVEDGKIKPTRDEAEHDPVDIYVERLVAKVRVSTVWNSSMEKEEVTFNGQKYTAIKLKERKKDGNVDILDSNGNPIYAVFTAWDLSGFTNKSYLFKQVNPGWDFTPKWAWNDAGNHRSYWAMNAKDVIYERRAHSEATAKIGSKRQSGSGSTLIEYDGDVLYCQENAADWSDNILTNVGKKSLYDPETQVGNRTQVYLKAYLVTIGEDKVATPVNLGIWGDVKYTENKLVVAMFKSVENIVYTATVTETEETINGEVVKTKHYDYHPITIDQVRLVNAEDAIGKDGKPKADANSEVSRRYLSYIQLIEDEKIFTTDAGLDGNYYEAVTENGETKYQLITRAQANGILSNMPGAREWRGGDTYYYVDIAHLNKQEGAEEVGMYGIVRNHIYDIEINTVYGLGTPVLTPKPGEGNEKDIIPQKPTNEAFYLGARINILSWRVVNQNVELEWD